VNLSSDDIIHTLQPRLIVRPTSMTLRMLNKTELKARGVTTLQVEHTGTLQVHLLEFHVAKSDAQCILIFHGCKALRLLAVHEA